MQRATVPLAAAESYRRVVRIVYTLMHTLYIRHISASPLRVLLRPLRHIVCAGFRRLDRLAEVRDERRYGIQTSGVILPAADTSVKQDAAAYEATPYGVIERVLAAVPFGEDDVFVDVGCGKGRVVCQAASRPFRKVIGLEMLPELAKEARQNAARVATVAPIEIVEGDAALTDISEGTIYYFFNPFGEATMAAVLDNIRRSLAQRPRPVRIVYTEPRLAALFDAQEWLQADAVLGDTTRVWRTR